MQYGVSARRPRWRGKSWQRPACRGSPTRRQRGAEGVMRVRARQAVAEPRDHQAVSRQQREGMPCAMARRSCFARERPCACASALYEALLAQRAVMRIGIRYKRNARRCSGSGTRRRTAPTVPPLTDPSYGRLLVLLMPEWRLKNGSHMQVTLGVESTITAALQYGRRTVGSAG